MIVRLTSFMQHERLTPAKLADMLDVQPSSISHLLGGRNKPGFDFLSKMFSVFPELNPRWFMLGEGEMLGGSLAAAKRSDDTIDTTADTIISASVNDEDKSNDQRIERIIILYAGGSFDEYSKPK